jgi:hypothetical protein
LLGTASNTNWKGGAGLVTCTKDKLAVFKSFLFQDAPKDSKFCCSMMQKKLDSKWHILAQVMKFNWPQILHDAEKNIIWEQWEISHSLQCKSWSTTFVSTTTHELSSEVLLLEIFAFHP